MSWAFTSIRAHNLHLAPPTTPSSRRDVPSGEGKRFRESEGMRILERRNDGIRTKMHMRRAGPRAESGATISCRTPGVINTCRGEGMSCSICVGSEGGR
eukprot:69981-Hanusia_phi.AAC.1